MERKSIMLLILLAVISYFSWAFAAGAAIEHETIACGNTATGFTASKISKTTGPWAGQKAAAALISVENNSIRFCIDGSAPTQGAAGICHKMDAGQSYLIRGEQNVSNFRCIDLTAGQASKIEATIFYGGD